ncbi:MAG: recombination protein RecR [Gammaproteobacteria bacterium]|jgi:recombination protein RecR|nr:recombination protein RecR [Gammaproteobacteria bacterium]
MFTPLVQELINSLRCLAGVGQKSAQRMAFQLLQKDRDAGFALAETLRTALTKVGHCQRCQTFSEFPLCSICTNPSRDPSQLCIVEIPTDVFALEQTRSYNGLYFVLMGHLSPIDGIGPDEIHIAELKQRLETENITEIILATGATVEGEATAHYIASLVQNTDTRCSRLAHGIPLDGELGYLDTGTLSRAITARTTLV